MKKVLIPILSVAAVAPATGSIASCSCSSAINMTLITIDSDDYFAVENFDLKPNKKYTFKADMSKASDDFIEGGSRHITFYGGNWGQEHIPFKLDKSSIVIKRNGEEIKEGEGGYKIIEQTQMIYIPFDSAHELKKTDVFTFTVAWTEGTVTPDSKVLLMPM